MAHVLTTAFADPGGSGHGFAVLVRDLSERAALEGQLREAQKMEVVGQLAGGVAHDFNNLLTVIDGCAAALAEQLPSGTRLHQNVADIRSAAERAASLTRQLLAFSRRQLVEPTVLDVNALLTRAAPLLRRLLGERVALEQVCADDLVSVKADATVVEQIVLNLCVNARDAMPEGGRLELVTRNRRLDTTLITETGLLQPGVYAELTIRDNGIGMTYAVRARIFEPFFSTKGPERGSGLGLSVVYGAIKQSSGGLVVESDPGVGTTMRVLFPGVPGSGDARSASIAPGARAATKGTREGVILLVDDEDVLRRLVRRMLEREGFTVLDAASGDQALALLKGRPIDLLVTDVVMPGMNGREVADRVQAVGPGTPVLFISGYTDDAVLRHGVELGRDQLLGKPFTRDALVDRVVGLMEGSRATQSR